MSEAELAELVTPEAMMGVAKVDPAPASQGLRRQGAGLLSGAAMQTRFEHHAASSMLCAEDAPPRRNGQLLFERPWEGRMFAVALALSRDGHYEWEDFRQSLIASIAAWEAEHADSSR